MSQSPGRAPLSKCENEGVHIFWFREQAPELILRVKITLHEDVCFDPIK